MKKIENMYYIQALGLAATVAEFLEYSYIPHIENSKSLEKRPQITEALALVINSYINKSTWMREADEYRLYTLNDAIAVNLSPAKNKIDRKTMPPKENIIPFSAITKVLEKFGYKIEDFKFSLNRSIYAYGWFPGKETVIQIEDFDKYNTRAYLHIEIARFAAVGKTKLIEEELREGGEIHEHDISDTYPVHNFSNFLIMATRPTNQLNI